MYFPSKLKLLNHIVLSTRYKHHSKLGGYDQLAKYTQPSAILGINELDPPNIILLKYKWLYEFLAKMKYKPRLLHIYYAEEYLRFSPFIQNMPVVATFHQPPENLERETIYGDYSGRVGKFTHAITKSRFSKLAAAIILEENQRAILEQVMPADKIHLIPHGIHPDLFKKVALEERQHVLTVGNWQRDWNLYESILQIFSKINPELTFVLVNRSLPSEVLAKLNKYPNFSYTSQVSDIELEYLYRSAHCLFLPLLSATANNSLIESLVYGCPVVTSDVFSQQYPFKGNYISFERSPEAYIGSINQFISQSEKQREDLAKTAQEEVATIKWPNVAEQVLRLYHTLI